MSVSPQPSPSSPPESTLDSTSRHGLIVVGAGGAGIGVVQQTLNSMPVTLIDKDPRREDLLGSLPGARYLHGDATSLLVLREAGVERAYALVAATSDDHVNIEACRLAVSCGVPAVFCRLHDATLGERVLKSGATPVTIQQALSRAIVSQLPRVALTTSEVGLGQGEILQVRVTAGSLAIGHSLKDIGTQEFVVAAIYRQGVLVVPHGDTIVEADDQVLLVGLPDTLGAVAEYFRVGTAQFPLQFGRNIVVWDRSRAPEVLQEAQWVMENTRVEGGLYRVSGDDPTDADPLSTPVNVQPLGLDLRESAQFAGLDAIHPGLYVVRAPFRRWLQQCGMTPIRALLGRAKAPILMARGTVPYRRILAPIGDSETSWMGMELAIDVARQLSATVTLLHARAPQFVVGHQGEQRATRIRRRAEEIARIYDIDMQVHEVEGNPIRRAQEAARDHQLCIVARRRGQRNTYLRPDIGLRIALDVPCSSVLLSIG